MLQSDGATKINEGEGGGARSSGSGVRAASGTGYSGTGVLYAPLGNYSRGS